MAVSSSFLTTPDGFHIAYAEHGEGAPLVFVRGFVTHLDILWSDDSFRSYFETLGRHFRVIRLDSRGNGMSERNIGHLSLDDLVVDLETLITSLDLGEVILYGATFGGPIVARYAARHADRVRCLVLEGTFSQGTRITTPVRRWMLMLALRIFPEMAFVLLSYATNPQSQTAYYRRPEVIQEMISPKAAVKLYSLAFGLDIREDLKQISVPTLVLHRKNSQSIPFNVGVEVAGLIPGAHLVGLEGEEHNLWEGEIGRAHV